MTDNGGEKQAEGSDEVSIGVSVVEKEGCDV